MMSVAKMNMYVKKNLGKFGTDVSNCGLWCDNSCNIV